MVQVNKSIKKKGRKRIVTEPPKMTILLVEAKFRVSSDARAPHIAGKV